MSEEGDQALTCSCLLQDLLAIFRIANNAVVNSKSRMFHAERAGASAEFIDFLDKAGEESPMISKIYKGDVDYHNKLSCFCMYSETGVSIHHPLDHVLGTVLQTMQMVRVRHSSSSLPNISFNQNDMIPYIWQRIEPCASRIHKAIGYTVVGGKRPLQIFFCITSCNSKHLWRLRPRFKMQMLRPGIVAHATEIKLAKKLAVQQSRASETQDSAHV